MAIIAEAEETTDSDLQGTDQLGKRNRDDTTPTADDAGRADAFPKMQRCGSLKEDSDSATMDTQSVHSTATRTMDNTNSISTPATDNSSQRDKDAKARAAEQLQAYRDEDNDQVSVASQGTWKTERSMQSHRSQISARRESDRQRYSAMSHQERKAYNAKRRNQYHRQSQESRQKQRERERNRYHTGVRTDDDIKEQNKRRAKLGREQLGRDSDIVAASVNS